MTEFFDTSAADVLVRRVSQGIEIAQLRSELARLFSLERSEADKRAFRKGEGVWKKVSEEISPVNKLFHELGIEEGTLTFLDHQGQSFPDFVYETDPVQKVALEVTLMGSVKAAAAKLLNARGIASVPLAPRSAKFHEIIDEAELGGGATTPEVLAWFEQEIRHRIKVKTEKYEPHRQRFPYCDLLLVCSNNVERHHYEYELDGWRREYQASDFRKIFVLLSDPTALIEIK